MNEGTPGLSEAKGRTSVCPAKGRCSPGRARHPLRDGVAVGTPQCGLGAEQGAGTRARWKPGSKVPAGCTASRTGPASHCIPLSLARQHPQLALSGPRLPLPRAAHWGPAAPGPTPASARGCIRAENNRRGCGASREETGRPRMCSRSGARGLLEARLRGLGACGRLGAAAGLWGGCGAQGGCGNSPLAGMGPEGSAGVGVVGTQWHGLPLVLPGSGSGTGTDRHRWACGAAGQCQGAVLGRRVLGWGTRDRTGTASPHMTSCRDRDTQATPQHGR